MCSSCQARLVLHVASACTSRQESCWGAAGALFTEQPDESSSCPKQSIDKIRRSTCHLQVVAADFLHDTDVNSDAFSPAEPTCSVYCNAAAFTVHTGHQWLCLAVL